MASSAIYNARRRYQRSAERYIKKAQATVGATAERYYTLAEQELDNAVKTYSQSNRQKYSSKMQEIAKSLDVDLEEQRTQWQNFDTSKVTEEQQKLVENSKTRLKKAFTPDERSEAEAKRLFNSGVGARIIGGLVDVWRDIATLKNGKVDKQKMIDAIFEYFGVDTYRDLLKVVENKIGSVIYASLNDWEKYKETRSRLQATVRADAPVLTW